MLIPDHGTHHRANSRTKTTSNAPCRKMTKFLSEIRSKNLNFRQEFCHLDLGRIRCRFGARICTMMRTMIRYKHVNFQNFLKSFQFFKFFSNAREHALSGAKGSFR